MKHNKSYGINSNKPIEKHNTAPWADIKSVDDESRVFTPATECVEEAKGWVDENEK